MKILQVMTGFELREGGVYQALCGLLSVLKNHHEITFLTTATKDESELAVIPGVKLICVRMAHDYRFSFEIKRYLEKLVPEHQLVHIHGLWLFPLSYAASCARRVKTPYVYHLHGMLNKQALKQHWIRKRLYAALWERKNLNRSNTIVCLTQDEEEAVREFNIKAPTVVIPNGVIPVSTADFIKKGEFRKRRKKLLNKFVILFLGRVHPQKGIDLLLNAFSKVQENDKNIHLVIAGPEEDERYAKEMRNLVLRHELQEEVTFLGPVYGEEKKNLLLDSDLFVLPSRGEGFSMGILEALSYGLPVIATDGCSFQELAAEGVGEIVRYDSGELSKAMTRVINNRDLRVSMGEKGRQLIEKKYRWDKIGGQLTDLYQQIVGRKEKKA